MKDFIFSDPSESDSKVIYRTDLIGSNQNFTVHQITGLEDANRHRQVKVALLKAFGKQKYSKQQFITFAQAHDLDLVMQDTDGSNSEILVDYNSDWASDSWNS